MSKQNSHQDLKASLKYSPHDLSHQLKFTSSVGQLLPVYWDFLSPGDKIEITPSMFSRLQNMTSPAFTRLTEHVDFFAVPMNQLYSPFEAVFYGVNDLRSDMFQVANVRQTYPTFDLANTRADFKTGYMAFRTDRFNVPHNHNFTRFCDLLQYGSKVIDQIPEGVQAVNPILLQAYQKIYQDFYRLSDREEKDVSSYNLDSYYNTQRIGADRMRKLFKLQYRPWKKDYFTNVKVTPLVNGGISIGMFNNWQPSENVPQWLNSSVQITPTGTDGLGNTLGPNQPVTDMASTSVPNPDSGQPTNVSVVTLKQMFSLYKLMKITAKAGKTIDKQQLAHFGVKMPKGSSGEVIYLGSSHGTIQVDSVVASTASDSLDTTQPLGALGGKAQGQVNGRKVSYTADQHVVIMAIYSCVPESDYSSVGMNRFHLYVNPEDFFKPELEQLGMQPMFGLEADYTQYFEQNNMILGWVERWRELKQKYDRISGGLLSNWRNWCTQRVVQDNNLESFLINPNMLDSIMLVPFESSNLCSASNPWATDPLIHVMHFDSRKLSKMNVETDNVETH